MSSNLKSIIGGAAFISASLLLPSTAMSGTYKYTGNNYNIPSNVIAYSGDSYTYEGLNTVQNNGRIEFKSGSTGTIAAGSKISLYPSTSNYSGTNSSFYGRKMGFMAHSGSTVHGFIDSNFNGISDYIEGLDADGDGLFDDLEDVLGTSNSQGTPGFEADMNGDGILDKVVNVVPGGTTSQFLPGGAFPGYLNGVSGSVSVNTFYQAHGTYYSQTVGYFNPSSVGLYFGSLSEWLNLYFSVTYTYFVFETWTQHVEFQAANGVEYVVQGYHNGSGWFDIDTILGTGGFESVILGGPNANDIYADLYADLPIFIAIVQLGKATINDGGGSVDSDEIEMDAVGSIVGDILTVNIPDVTSLPSSTNIDWIDKRVFGNTTPWEIDMNGDGATDVTLDPINESGKISVPILGKTVEIEVKNGQGVFVSIGRYKVGQSPDGTLLVELPDTITGSDGTLRLSYKIPKPNAAVDLNRNGTIDFNRYDATAVNDPYVFWVNNDYDRLHTVDITDSEEDDLEVPIHLSGGDAILPDLQYKRDLEDLTRIWLDLNEFTSTYSVSDQSISLRVRIKESDGFPSLNLFHSVESGGLRKYLTDEAIADSQLQGVFGQELCSASYGNFVQTLPRRAWENLPSSKLVHLLFEGQVEGEGELLFYFEKNGQTIYSFDPIYLKLVDVTEMYETWTVGEAQQGGVDHSLWPLSAAAKVGGHALPQQHPTSNQSKDYVLFVHGWNMSPFDKDWFSNTAFKRLWHQGYKGQFGSFRWPTFYGFPLTNLDHFNLSEERAWRSGLPLSNLIKFLSLQYNVTGNSEVRIYAHSMGNIVASEALRELNGGNEVHTYVSAQAALSAHVWDNSRPPKSQVSNTPNVYGYYWKTGETLAPHQWNSSNGNKEYMDVTHMPSDTRYVNHYNENDWALTNVLGWETNQWLKPDGGYGYFSPSFQKLDLGLQWVDLNFPNDRFEVFSYAADSISKATGSESNVGGLFSIHPGADLDLEFGFGSPHKGHSGQFRSTIQKRSTYWERLLNDMAVTFP